MRVFLRACVRACLTVPGGSLCALATFSLSQRGRGDFDGMGEGGLVKKEDLWEV